jgi:two-component system OmpR family sensor kinase
VSIRPLARLGLRMKMTLAFAGAMALLLAALGTFVYLRVEGNLDRSVNQGLHSRAEDVRALVMQADSGLRQAGASSLAAPDERFAQVVGLSGKVLDATPSLPSRSVLSPSELARAASAPVLVARQAVAGPAGSSRLFAIPVRAQGQRNIVIVGSSLRQRDASLGEVGTVLLIGGPVALLLASLLGYAVSALALRHVESMRRRALHVSLGEPGQRLPVPPSNDELARLARTLNEMIARNEVAFQRERAFVADASHELRSPLAILRAELDVALLGDSSQRELRHAMASAGEEADRLSVLTEDLLVLAEADQGNLAINAEPMDVAKSLQRLAERFGARAREAGAMIETLASPGLSVRADERRLEQALANLLENSLRHGAHRILVRAQLDGSRLELHVSDDGPGFPPAFLEVAFERFTRAERARTAPGAGLGLSIVRSIARAHGGEAYIANDDGGGAHVWLSIPDAPAPTSRSGAPQSASRPASVSAP